MTRDYPPEHLVLCELLQDLCEHVEPARRQYWEQMLYLLKRGTGDLLMENSDLKTRLYMLEKRYFYRDSNTPKTLFLTDIEALKNDLSRWLNEEDDDNNEDDNAKKDA